MKIVYKKYHVLNFNNDKMLSPAGN